MSTNKNLYGASVYAGYAFIAPNEAFEAPIMEVPNTLEDGTISGTKMVSITEYFTMDVGSAITNRKVIALKKGTHSLGMFEMSTAKGDFDKNKQLMKDNGLKDSGDDFTLDTLDCAYMLNHSEIVEFLEVSPLNQEVV